MTHGTCQPTKAAASHALVLGVIGAPPVSPRAASSDWHADFDQAATSRVALRFWNAPPHPTPGLPSCCEALSARSLRSGRHGQATGWTDSATSSENWEGPLESSSSTKVSFTRSTGQHVPRSSPSIPRPGEVYLTAIDTPHSTTRKTGCESQTSKSFLDDAVLGYGPETKTRAMCQSCFLPTLEANIRPGCGLQHSRLSLCKWCVVQHKLTTVASLHSVVLLRKACLEHCSSA